MKSPKRRWIALLVVLMLVQAGAAVWIPVSEEAGLAAGLRIRLPVMLADPWDPFRGRYLNLDLDLKLDEGQLELTKGLRIHFMSDQGDDAAGRPWRLVAEGSPGLGADHWLDLGSIRLVEGTGEVTDRTEAGSAAAAENEQGPALAGYGLRFADGPLRFYLQEDHARWADAHLGPGAARTGAGAGSGTTAPRLELLGTVSRGRFIPDTLYVDGVELAAAAARK